MRSWSGRARTGSRPRSRSRRRGAPCASWRRLPRSVAAARTEELTLPGFRHDVCSAIHPLGLGSPFLRTLPLARHGLEYVHPEIPLAHPLDDGSAVALQRSLDETADGLGVDAGAYRRLVAPLADDADALIDDLVGPLRVPGHPVTAARFGLSGLRSACGLARSRFAGERARALLGGNAAHSMQPLERPTTAAFGLILLVLGHGVGWPAAAGGSQAIADVDGVALALPRRRDRDGRRGTCARRARRCAQRALRSDAPPGTRDRRRRPSAPLPPGARALPATAPASSRSTTRSTARCPGRRRRAGAPARCTSAAPRGDRPGRGRGRARPASPAPYVLVAPAEPVRPDPSTAPARTRCGPTATSRTARAWT